MKRPHLHHVLVAVGLLAGVGAGLMFDTEPRVLGWIFGIGMGLAGGAFMAAIFTGESLVGRGDAPAAHHRGARRGLFDEPLDDAADGDR